jgi:hypothetical protein
VVPNRAEVVKHSTGSKRVAVPAEARWFRNRLQGMTERGILEIVRQLDAQMNNTSLILLFEYGSGAKNRKLLFPGDAQLENWSHVLQGATDSAEKRELLAEVDFYKVGHHGSLNATPKKSLWQNFRKRQGRQLLTMMSTLGGKHGKTANKTEVPRKTLVTALENGSRLSSTQDIEPSALEQVVTI